MTEPRIPPRFVPTLTNVIEIGPSLPGIDDDALALPAAGLASASAADGAAAMALDPAARRAEAATGELEERLLQRVMARIDPLLDDRLNDAVAAAVEAQLDAMVPRLRHDMQTVLRALIHDALASEIAENPGSTLP